MQKKQKISKILQKHTYYRPKNQIKIDNKAWFENKKVDQTSYYSRIGTLFRLFWADNKSVFESCLLFFVKKSEQYLLDIKSRFEEKIDFVGGGGLFRILISNEIFGILTNLFKNLTKFRSKSMRLWPAYLRNWPNSLRICAKSLKNLNEIFVILHQKL